MPTSCRCRRRNVPLPAAERSAHRAQPPRTRAPQPRGTPDPRGRAGRSRARATPRQAPGVLRRIAASSAARPPHTGAWPDRGPCRTKALRRRGNPARAPARAPRRRASPRPSARPDCPLVQPVARCSKRPSCAREAPGETQLAAACARAPSQLRASMPATTVSAEASRCAMHPVRTPATVPGQQQHQVVRASGRLKQPQLPNCPS